MFNPQRFKMDLILGNNLFNYDSKKYDISYDHVSLNKDSSESQLNISYRKFSSDFSIIRPASDCRLSIQEYPIFSYINNSGNIVVLIGTEVQEFSIKNNCVNIWYSDLLGMLTSFRKEYTHSSELAIMKQLASDRYNHKPTNTLYVALDMVGYSNHNIIIEESVLDFSDHYYESYKSLTAIPQKSHPTIETKYYVINVDHSWINDFFGSGSDSRNICENVNNSEDNEASEWFLDNTSEVLIEGIIPKNMILNDASIFNFEKFIYEISNTETIDLFRLRTHSITDHTIQDIILDDKFHLDETTDKPIIKLNCNSVLVPAGRSYARINSIEYESKTSYPLSLNFDLALNPKYKLNTTGIEEDSTATEFDESSGFLNVNVYFRGYTKCGGQGRDEIEAFIKAYIALMEAKTEIDKTTYGKTGAEIRGILEKIGRKLENVEIESWKANWNGLFPDD